MAPLLLQVADGLKDVAQAALAAYESGELQTALAAGHDGYKVGLGLHLPSLGGITRGPRHAD